MVDYIYKNHGQLDQKRPSTCWVGLGIGKGILYMKQVRPDSDSSSETFHVDPWEKVVTALIQDGGSPNLDECILSDVILRNRSFSEYRGLSGWGNYEISCKGVKPAQELFKLYPHVLPLLQGLSFESKFTYEISVTKADGDIFKSQCKSYANQAELGAAKVNLKKLTDLAQGLSDIRAQHENREDLESLRILATIGYANLQEGADMKLLSSTIRNLEQGIPVIEKNVQKCTKAFGKNY